MRIALVFLSFCILNTSCKGQEKEKCSDDDIIVKIKKRPEVISDSIRLRKVNKSITFQMYRDTIDSKVYRVFKEAADDEFHISTLHLYYVDNQCRVFSYDTLNDSLLPLTQKQKPMAISSAADVEFSDLFNDGTNIPFSPADLNQNNTEIQSFRKKLEIFERENPLPEDFDVKNLSVLLNNETFFDSQHYTHSSWLQYFIRKNKINAAALHDLMADAISKEDYNAVKILLQNHYIISEKDLKTVSEADKNAQQKTAENKTDGYESYVVKNSKIKDISKMADLSFKNNHIQDLDGYTNLRKGKNTSSEILQKVNSGEKIDVVDSFGDWFLIKTKEGKEGYIHQSRIKNN